MSCGGDWEAIRIRKASVFLVWRLMGLTSLSPIHSVHHDPSASAPSTPSPIPSSKDVAIAQISLPLCSLLSFPTHAIIFLGSVSPEAWTRGTLPTTCQASSPNSHTLHLALNPEIPGAAETWLRAPWHLALCTQWSFTHLGVWVGADPREGMFVCS